MKKITILLTFLFFQFSVVASQPTIESKEATQPSGSGTATDPYKIGTLNELRWVSETDSVWDKHFKVIADINASESQNWNEGKGFQPIGNFRGVLNGNGFAIESLFIDRENEDTVGFIATASEAEISNLRLKNIDITGGRFTGAIAGNGGASVEKVSISGTIHGKQDYTGGIIGKVTAAASIKKTSSSATVISDGQPEESQAIAGGLIGGAEEMFVIQNSYTSGTVDGEGNLVGGLVGSGDEVSFEIRNSYASGLIEGTDSVGGLIGGNASGTIKNCFWDSLSTNQDTSAGGGAPKTTTEMQNIATFTDITTEGLDEAWDFTGNPNDDSAGEDIWTMDEENSYPVLSWELAAEEYEPEGSGTQSDPYQIASLEDLRWLSQDSSVWDKYYIQVSDIDASSTQNWDEGKGFSPVGNDSIFFNGSYNGKNYTISGLYINRDNLAGLFGRIGNSGRIQNLNLLNVTINSDEFAGGLAAKSKGDIDSVKIDSIDIDIESDALEVNTGGLIGWNEGDIDHVLVANLDIHITGGDNMDNSSGKVGGIVGHDSSNETFLSVHLRKGTFSLGNQQSRQWGGLFGYIKNSSLTKSSAEGLTMTGAHYETGGLVGQFGYFSGGTISECYSEGYIEDTTGWTGGLVGRFDAGTITDCWSDCSSGGGLVGGQGCAGCEPTLKNSYAMGEVQGSNSGIVDDGNGLSGADWTSTYINSFFNTESTGQQNSGVPPECGLENAAKTAEEMRDTFLYIDAGWDFENTWYMDEYPQLQWERTFGISLSVKNSNIYLDSTGVAEVKGEHVITNASGFYEIADTIITQNLFSCSAIDSTIEIDVQIKNTNGDSISKKTKVTVVDTLGPAILHPVNDTFAIAGEYCQATMPDFAGIAEAQDNCSSDLDIVQSTEAGTTIYGQNNSLTISATDEYGNTTHITFNVAVKDTVPPTITSTHTDQLFEAGENCETTVPDYTGLINATDNCFSQLKFSQTPGAGTTVSEYVNPVTLYAKDAQGNRDSVQFNILLDDTIEPTVTCSEDSTIQLEDTTIYTVSGTLFDPVNTSDNCGIVEMTNDYNESSTLDGATFTSGAYTITWTVTDGGENQAECSFELTINDPVGIQTLAEAGIKLYPNPASDMLNIESRDKKVQSIRLTGLDGKTYIEKVQVKQNESIDISNLPEGIYIIQIQTPKGSFTGKVVKN